MYTQSDAKWMIETRKREVYQASEARWQIEGITMVLPQNTGSLVGKIKAHFIYRKTVSSAADIVQSQKSAIHVLANIWHNIWHQYRR